MQPLTIFETHFSVAQVLLKVHRLLETDASPAQVQSALPKVRDAVGCESDEQVILLLNDLFLGLVRQQADLPPDYFRSDNLSLLLRQATVSACTAMDVFFPSLLEQYLPTVVRVKRRNFLPKSGEVKTLFENFRLRLEDIPALLEEDDADVRWNILARRILDYCRDRVTFATVQGVTATMTLLGIEKPWAEVAERAGVPETALRNQIQAVVKRRNDVSHRGDRPVGQPDAPPQSIDYAWTYANVSAIQSVALACDALAKESLRGLEAEAAAA